MKHTNWKLPVNYDKLHWTERREVRDQYVAEQEGKCYYCKCPLNRRPPECVKRPIDWGLFPANFLRYPVHLHHCHDTGMTIGAVHAYCNAVLWQYHGE